jgi:hypothetical protein
VIALTLAVTMLAAMQDPAPTATPTPPPPAKAAKRICRREAPIGSIMAHQTCHSRAEWAAIDNTNGNNWDTARRANAARNMAIPQTLR